MQCFKGMLLRLDKPKSWGYVRSECILVAYQLPAVIWSCIFHAFRINVSAASRRTQAVVHTLLIRVTAGETISRRQLYIHNCILWDYASWACGQGVCCADSDRTSMKYRKLLWSNVPVTGVCYCLLFLVFSIRKNPNSDLCILLEQSSILLYSNLQGVIFCSDEHNLSCAGISLWYK